MSHFIRSKSQLTDIDMIRAALSHMKINVSDKPGTVQQYGEKEEVQILLDKGDNKTGAVGLSLQKDGTYSLVGDFYHAADRELKKFYNRNTEFMTKLQTSYSFCKAKKDLTDNGFFISENEDGEVSEDGLIHMVAVSYS